MRRGEILAAKTLALFTYLAIVLMIFAAAGTIVGAIALGLRPLANISGQRISAAARDRADGRRDRRRSRAAHGARQLRRVPVGHHQTKRRRRRRHHIFYALALQGLAGLPAIKAARPYLLITKLNAWHAPFQTPTNWGMIGHASWISAVYATVPLAAAWINFQRRDVTS